MTAWPVQLPLTQGCIKNPSPGWAACPCKLRPSQGGGEGMGVGGTAARAGGPVPHRLQKPEPRSHPQGQGQRTALGRPHAQGGRTTKGGGERAQGASSWKRCTAADTGPQPRRPPSRTAPQCCAGHGVLGTARRTTMPTAQEAGAQPRTEGFRPQAGVSPALGPTARGAASFPFLHVRPK